MVWNMPKYWNHREWEREKELQRDRERERERGREQDSTTLVVALNRKAHWTSITETSSPHHLALSDDRRAMYCQRNPHMVDYCLFPVSDCTGKYSSGHIFRRARHDGLSAARTVIYYIDTVRVISRLLSLILLAGNIQDDSGQSVYHRLRREPALGHVARICSLYSATWRGSKAAPECVPCPILRSRLDIDASH